MQILSLLSSTSLKTPLKTSHGEFMMLLEQAYWWSDFGEFLHIKGHPTRKVTKWEKTKINK